MTDEAPTTRDHHRATGPLAALMVAAAATLLAPTIAGALELRVTTLADEADAAPGDGRCATLAGACSLRAAFEEANAHPGLDGIRVPPGTYALTHSTGIDGCADPLTISDALTLRGAGAERSVIDASAALRGIHIDARAGVPLTVDVAGLSIESGGNTQHADRGGCLLVNGASDGVVELELADVVLRDCFARITGGAMAWLNVGGRAALYRTQVLDGTTNGSGGGVSIRGTAGAEPVLEVVDSILARNLGWNVGGAIVAVAAHVAIERSTLHENGVAFDGGGIHAEAGTLVVTNSTLSSNRGTVGAIYAGATMIAPVQLTNVTITGSGGTWGALRAELGGPGFEVERCILNGLCSGHAYVSLGGNVVREPNDPTDTRLTCRHDGPSDAIPVPSDQIGLAPLADNGGLTPTHALLPSSPAVDAALAGTCPATDQRARVRDDGACDAGAFELGARGCAAVPGSGGPGWLFTTLLAVGLSCRRRLSPLSQLS